MRFSAVFNRPRVPLRRPGVPVSGREAVAPADVPGPPPAQDLPTPARELPLDLDQRVRLVGEW